MSVQPLPYHDRIFLDSDEGRPLRILAEYLEPKKRFEEQGIQDTVVFFGSARTHSQEPQKRGVRMGGGGVTAGGAVTVTLLSATARPPGPVAVAL